jgi:putative ABC transport system permease protein
MITHLLKFVWNRRQTNLLVIIEIFFSFLVLTVVITFGVYYAESYRRPPGFGYENVWYISMRLGYRPSYSHTGTMEDSTAMRQVYLALQDLEEIEAVGATQAVPFLASSWNTSLGYKGKGVQTECGAVTDDLKEVLGLKVVHGRWFEKSDDALNYEPVIINQRLSQELFGTEDPLGKETDDGQYRVVGVISDYRYHVESQESFNFMFKRINWNRSVTSGYSSYLPTDYLIKVRRGTPGAFEEKLVKKLQAVARDWSCKIKPLSQMRASFFKQRLTFLIVLGIVTAFLLIMVGLGLMGVLWQNVTQRTKEIGLRRANGATAEEIYTQILGELLIITSIGVVIGIAVVIQFFPLLDMLKLASMKVYLSGLVISCVLLYGLVILCGLYPSYLATRVHPAEALHYE